MKVAVKRLPYSPRVRLPCTYSMVLHIIQQNTQQHSSKDCFMLAVGVSMAYYLCLRASEYVSKTKVPNPESHQFDSRSVEFKCFSTNYLVPSSSMHSICWTSVDIIRFTIQHAKNIRRGHGVPIWFSTREPNTDANAFLQLVYLWSRLSTRLPDDPFLSYRYTPLPSVYHSSRRHRALCYNLWFQPSIIQTTLPQDGCSDSITCLWRR